MVDPAASALRILHVDDDRVNRLVLDDLLRLIGHEPTACASGEEALAMLARGAFDMIMTDIHMPGLTGHELLQKLREQGVALPVVAVTADLMTHSPEQYVALGFSAVVTKPVSPDALRATLVV